MKRNLLNIFLMMLFLWCIGSNAVKSQETRNLTRQRTTSERAAEGQTKWMINYLQLDKSLYDIIYKINLKYQTISDSIHFTNTIISAKQETYLQCAESRNEELKKVLPADAFDRFMSITKTVKDKAAVYRAPVQK